MAECQYDSIVVTSDGGPAGIEGTYTKNGTFNGFSLFTKEGGWSIRCSPSGPPGWNFWGLRKIIDGDLIVSYTITGPAPSQPDCPPEGTYTQGALGVTGPITLTYAALEPELPTFGLPAETVALITSRFGTVARFLRLRNLGQI